MKKLTAIAALVVATSPAWAADLPPAMPRAPVAYMPAAAPVFSWTGFYIGGNIGGGWSRGNVVDSAFGVNFTNGNSTSFLGGARSAAIIRLAPSSSVPRRFSTGSPTTIIRVTGLR
jgi:outer membrane immunogenic protein